ncbi:G2 and S-phase expressed 1 [Chelydra serpentina]|uniref:G2 and S-phase expressed 1 n=1 Tax=Chelydra serpentina TaxID=8475 RepID=A0A8T1T3F1_CHESE|nr:G2 and S-phase expressed 1 [Chelydra serpentina]
MEEGKEMSVGWSSNMAEEKLDVCKNSDFPLLTDEKFDFDLSLSPASGNEDEVFVGPLGHKEKCVAVSIEATKDAEGKISQTPDDKLMWSPLNGEKFVEIFKEAHLLALQLESGNKNEQNKVTQSEGPKPKVIEKFVQASKSKLKIFQKGNIEKSPRAIKRETYCVWDSPICQLPPSFQKRSDLPVTAVDKTPPNTSSPIKIHKFPKISVSPLAQEQQSDEKNKKAISKLHTKASSALGKSHQLAVEKPKPGKKHLNSMGSSEDLLSDKSSVASDVCDSSFSGSSSLQDKRVLPSQSKFGLRKTQLKPPSVANGPLRKNTSSSSSSSISSMNSSLNSSLSVSPIGGNAKSSLSSKISVSSSKLSSSTKRLAMVRPIRTSSLQAVHSDVSCKQTRSVSTPKISTAGNLAKCSASVTGSQTLASGIQRLSSVPNLQKISQQNKDGSAAKGNTCPKGNAKIILTPTNQIKVSKRCGGSSSENTASKIIEPIRLLSCGTFGSGVAVCTPVKSSEDGASQNSRLSSRSILITPASIKRSALPTPASRRISGIPTMTPKTFPRSVSSPHFMSVRQVSSVSTRKTLVAGSKQAKDTKTQVSSFEDDDLSPPPMIPLTLVFSPEKITEIAQNEIQEETEIQKQPAEGAQTNEVLLVDIGIDETPIAALEYESKPLIDLSNTPEVNKVIPLKPSVVGQLIDLSSPLITLSPEVNKENLDSPLLKF